MSKRRQHFVPKFYLRRWETAPQRVNLFHLASSKAIREASLRDQCYAHRFYGGDESLEDELAAFEGAAAPALRRVIDDGNPPKRGSEDHAVLLAFVALQTLRTSSARENIKDSYRKMDEQIFGDQEPAPSAAVQKFSPVSEGEALALLFKILPKYVQALADLHLHVASSTSKNQLITSDNPVFRYNSYCRGIRYWGSLGGISRGLQVFLPLSPRILLLLYDRWVYRPTRRGLSAQASFRERKS